MINQHDIDRVATSMIAHGGSFIASIGQSLLIADSENAKLIKDCWPWHWDTYKELAEKDENRK